MPCSAGDGVWCTTRSVGTEGPRGDVDQGRGSRPTAPRNASTTSAPGPDVDRIADEAEAAQGVAHRLDVGEAGCRDLGIEMRIASHRSSEVPGVGEGVPLDDAEQLVDRHLAEPVAALVLERPRRVERGEQAVAAGVPLPNRVGDGVGRLGQAGGAPRGEVADAVEDPHLVGHELARRPVGARGGGVPRVVTGALHHSVEEEDGPGECAQVLAHGANVVALAHPAERSPRRAQHGTLLTEPRTSGRRTMRRARRHRWATGVAVWALLGAVLATTSVDAAEPADDAEPARQYPFVCTTARAGLGQPKIDNQDGEGIPVAQEDANGDYPRDGRGYPTAEATIIGWSRDCEVDPVVEYRYMNTSGSVAGFDDPTTIPATLPADVAMTTTSDGVTVPYLIRWERGTMNRFLYSVAMLAPATERDAPDDSLWNGRLLFHFDGGVAIGHTQGRLSTSDSLYDPALSLGTAVLFSSGTRTNTHYNLKLGGETAVMVKDHFVATHGEPVYTVGVGGSGGGIQQYVYAQNHPGLLDGGVPQYSYPDMVTQTISVGDCELLEYYFDVTDGDNERWRDVDQRQLIEGLNAEPRPRNLSDGAIEQWSLVYGAYPLVGASPPATPPGAPTPGLTECRAAWFGLTPLVLNPTFTDVDDLDKLANGAEGVEWTHWGDAVDVYGTDADGYGRVPWDNVGVQYGLNAVSDGSITPEEFLDLNAGVGTWKESSDMVPTGCPFDFDRCTDFSEFDPWSSRQMRHSPDGGTTPAPRRTGDLDAMRAAYDAGLVFRGEIDIPMIDWRHYLEEQLDMHNSSQSFASRARITAANGHADNHVIWWTDARPEVAFDQTPMALEVLHEWITNLQADPAAGVGAARPDAAVDSCFNTDGSLHHAGDDAWSGAVDDSAPGPCTELMPTYSTSRREAGGPLSGALFKCQTEPVWKAITEGDYGTWRPDHRDRARLEQIFPEGVCDYSLADLGDPRTPTPPAGDVVLIREAKNGTTTDLSGTAVSGDITVERAGDAIDRIRGAVTIDGPDGASTVHVHYVRVAERTAFMFVLVRDADGQYTLRFAPVAAAIPWGDGVTLALGSPLGGGMIGVVVDDGA